MELRFARERPSVFVGGELKVKAVLKRQLYGRKVFRKGSSSKNLNFQTKDLLITYG